MTNKVRRHGLHLVAFQSAIFVFNPHVAFVQPSELERPEVDVPDAIVDSPVMLRST